MWRINYGGFFKIQTYILILLHRNFFKYIVRYFVLPEHHGDEVPAPRKVTGKIVKIEYFRHFRLKYSQILLIYIEHLAYYSLDKFQEYRLRIQNVGLHKAI